jgi:hypothetical protein
MLHNKASEGILKQDRVGYDLYSGIADTKALFLKYCKPFEKRLRTLVPNHRVVLAGEGEDGGREGESETGGKGGKSGSEGERDGQTETDRQRQTDRDGRMEKLQLLFLFRASSWIQKKAKRLLPLSK